MKIPIARTPHGVEIFLTDEHPACAQYSLPVVAVGNGPEVVVLGRADLIKTTTGLYDAGRLVMEWLEKEERLRQYILLAIQFLSRTPEHL